MSDTSPPFRRCRVFIPYAEVGGRLDNVDYEDADVWDDLATWFADPKLDWDWVPVTARTLADVVADVGRAAPPGEIAVVNLCDGDDHNGFPGLSVIHALEAAGLPYTGADPAFFERSTRKLVMKPLFAAAGVATSPWVAIHDPEVDLRRAAETIGFPLFIKPDMSAGAAGICRTSLVHDHDQAMARVRLLLGGMHGLSIGLGGIFAERYLPGREFTVLVIADAAHPDGFRALRPCEKRFDPSLPPGERFSTHDLGYIEEATEDGAPAYYGVPVEDEIVEPLRRTAMDAFAAVGGTGYGRVDIRQDGDGRFVVLEVNAACALSSPHMAFSGATIRQFLDLMLWDAWRRWRRADV
ncbi:MAG: hypothetical protein HQL40_06305 [Alphaproteobacteria bacterium]|nr:hypothetical protein [Alphaproteobacteria bacterium]